jgi:DNA polymerase-1
MTASTLYLIDGNSYLYRAFHALPYLSNSRGQPTNAILGFTQMLLKVLREKDPDYVAVAFDHKGKTHRHGVYEEYKIHRPPMPDALSLQLPYIFRLVEAFRLPLLMMEGYEADDILATLATRGKEKGFQVTLVTGDKDVLQLVGPSVRVYDSMREVVVGEEEVRRRFGVDPDKVVEIMGLMGDASDNIPGVPGIGEKTASSLIREYGSIEALREALPHLERRKLKENLERYLDLALLSRQLATLRTDLPLTIDWEELKRRDPDWRMLTDLLRELEFYHLLQELAPAVPTPEGTWQIVQEETELAALLARLKEAEAFGLEVEASGREPMRAELRGISLAMASGQAYYLPLASVGPQATGKLLADQVLHRMKSILEGSRPKKYGHDLKSALVLLGRAGVKLDGLAFDTMVASYLLNPNKTAHPLEDLALGYLGRRLGPGAEKGAAGEAWRASCVRAEAVLQLVPLLQNSLREWGLEDLYCGVEMPLISVLAAMERNGFKVAVEPLQQMSQDLEREMMALSSDIFELAKGEFNINSPKQLSEVLFRRLGLPPLRKTKTGFSTDVEVLEQLALIHPLPARILQYRSLAKLKSTYLDVLPRLMNPETGRIHTTFNQTVTATGRLSSSEPNLQNIPVRTEMGRRIREAFIAEEGWLLLSADYSQIELRILAHLSGDQVLITSFQRGEDIHRETAARIFGIPREQVDSDQRRMAKTINFGIIYGMSPYGLSTELGVSQEEAKRYIDEYFTSYAGVKEFLNRLLEEARASGAVTTMFGRRRPIPHLHSRDAMTRQLGERMAVNTPIQGSAADLIKKAMVAIHSRLSGEGYRAKMILQVHDELILEVPEREVPAVEVMVREEMEKVTQLKVPIRVDIGVGKNWREAHP